MLFHNLKDKFPSCFLLHVDVRIKSEFMDSYKDFVVFRDKNFNIHSVNFFSEKIFENINYQFGELPFEIDKKIKKIIKKSNQNYKFSDCNYFMMGKVEKRNHHPKSDKLFILTVNFENSLKQIVTNTSYTLENKSFIFALPGAITYPGTEIVEGEILGIKSQGMLTTGESLNIIDKSNVLKGEFDYLKAKKKLRKINIFI